MNQYELFPVYKEDYRGSMLISNKRAKCNLQLNRVELKQVPRKKNREPFKSQRVNGTRLDLLEALFILSATAVIRDSKRRNVAIRRTRRTAERPHKVSFLGSDKIQFSVISGAISIHVFSGRGFKDFPSATETRGNDASRGQLYSLAIVHRALR